jgi:PAS domain S-box-containing protein
MSKPPADEPRSELEALQVPSDASESQIRQLVEELSVHQAELRAQQRSLEEAQGALEMARDRYAALFDFAPIGCISFDATGTVDEINVTATRLIGAERSRLVGVPFVICVFPPDRRRFLDHVMRCRRGEPLVRSELRINAPAGPVDVEFTTKRMEEGENVFFYSVMVDLTERRRVETDRIGAKIELQRLQHETEVAQEASAAKDQFLAVLSHELRTPLTTVLMGIGELEEMMELPSMARTILRMMERNVELEARLIDDLLDVTRISRGKLIVESEPLDLHPLLTEIAAPYDLKARDARVELSVELRAKDPSVQGDAKRLSQVMWNLLENAFNHTPSGQITLESEDVDAEHVRIVVSDTGIGIPAGNLERIFLPFDQGSEDGRRGGLGLGLAICKSLVEAHGGTIRANSDGEGAGARFEIVLPTVDRPQGSGALDASGEGAEAAAERSRVLRILLVEDHVDTADSIALYLRHRGHQVIVAHTVEDAARTEMSQFEVLLSDLQLPDGSGLDLLERFRRRGPVRAIAMSGYGTQADRQRSIAAGFQRHLVKPVSVRAALEAIQEVTES